MSAPSPEIPARYEFKYLVGEAEADLVRRALPPFCQLDRYSSLAPGHRYPISSLYFDTPTHQLYWASRAEQPGRLKVRVRAYGEGGPVYFEVKRKTHGVVRKSRARVASERWRERLGGAVPADAGRVEQDFRAQVDRHLLEPATLVRYRREAWFGLYDEYARVTFDFEVQFQAARTLDLEGDAGAWLPLDDPRSTRSVRRAVVIELKCGLFAPVWMARLVERLSLFRLSYSKYCTSVERGFGRLNPQRLAPTAPMWR